MEEFITPEFAIQKRQPLPPELSRANQSLIGSIPALDVLNLAKNEGLQDLDRDYNLLFAASGDLRNIVKTIVSLPAGYTGRCTVVFNDFNFTVVARNVILLLTALSLKPEEAVPTMIHLWYSAFIPITMLMRLRDLVLPQILSICEMMQAETEEPGEMPKAHTLRFKQSATEVHIALWKDQWMRLRNFFFVPSGHTKNFLLGRRIRAVARKTRSRVDAIDRYFYSLRPGSRGSYKMFLSDGILLPYSSPRAAFDTPNPTFFQEIDVSWPLDDDADPIRGWNYEEFNPQNRNDVYGELFIYLRSLFLDFCKRLKSGNFAFHAFSADAHHFAAHHQLTDRDGSEIRFDRIEVSNVCDEEYMQLGMVLNAFVSLLRSRTKNPHATLLLLFINNMLRSLRLDLFDRPEVIQLSQHFGLPREGAIRRFPQTDGGFLSPEDDFLERCKVLFVDFDVMFAGLSEEFDVEELVKDEDGEIKTIHTIIAPWPFRVTGDSTWAQFEARLAARLWGFERFVEVRRLT